LIYHSQVTTTEILIIIYADNYFIVSKCRHLTMEMTIPKLITFKFRSLMTNMKRDFDKLRTVTTTVAMRERQTNKQTNKNKREEHLYYWSLTSTLNQT